MRFGPVGFLILISGIVLCLSTIVAQQTYEVVGLIEDLETGEAIPGRVYVQSDTGEWFHVSSLASDGRAIAYSKDRGNGSVEIHTSISAGPFIAKLPPGNYTITAEQGKEYVMASAMFSVGEDTGIRDQVVLSLQRWVDMASRGWYSGETHVHRLVDELPTLMLAENLNVAFPLTAWVTDNRDTPKKNSRNPEPVPAPELIEVDATHVIWPVNTEYEIFTVNGNRHTLGAVFVLNHSEPLGMPAPPVRPIAEEASRQGAILELDKHNWPWSMMIVPVMGVGLYELTNNHIWRTKFRFTDWYEEYAAEYMNIEMKDGKFTERGWIDFGFKNYYALLNCGFDMKPTGGTASGVHPVPLGFGRVYVKLDGDFSYAKWLDGLTAGRSFVTTGPMLEVDVRRLENRASISGTFLSSFRPGPVEVILNGDVVETLAPKVSLMPDGGSKFDFETSVEIVNSGWVAVRGFEDRYDGRPRFAHTAPVHFAVPGKPLRPKRVEVEYLIERVKNEIQRHQGVLEEVALEEYRAALESYRGILEEL